MPATRPKDLGNVTDVNHAVVSREMERRPTTHARPARGAAVGRLRALALAAVCLLVLARAAGAQEKTDFKEQGGGEETKADADDEEDVAPEHEETEEDLGPFQLRRPKYKLVRDDEDPDYFGQLGVRRLTPIPEVRKAFREEARKYRDVLMRCNHPECFPSRAAAAANATAANATAANATAANATAANATAVNASATGGAKTSASATARSDPARSDPARSEEGADPAKPRRKPWTPTLNGFKNMTEAYRVLSDPLRKRVYEVSGKAGLDGKHKPQFQDPLREPYKLEMAFKTGTFKMDFGFKEGQQKNTGNVHHNIKIPMIGFYTGFHMDVSIVRGELCPHCNGTGAAENAEMLSCPTCKGSGKEERNSFWRAAHCPHARRRAQRYTGFDSTVTVACKNCEGTGKLASEPCPRCGGKRTLDGKVTVTVNIEPGMLEGHAFTFKEHAEQMPGVTSGDVILHVYSEEHDDFEREGSDLVTHQVLCPVRACIRARTHTHTRTRTHTRTHTHTHTHTHAHTHTHTHTQGRQGESEGVHAQDMNTCKRCEFVQQIQRVHTRGAPGVWPYAYGHMAICRT